MRVGPGAASSDRRRSLRKGGTIPAHVGGIHVEVVDVHPAEEAQEDTMTLLTHLYK